jgi:hypothetical protein
MPERIGEKAVKAIRLWGGTPSDSKHQRQPQVKVIAGIYSFQVRICGPKGIAPQEPEFMANSFGR